MFALKHIVWVLVRTASMIIYVFSKNMKIVKNIQLKIVIFTVVKNRCILHGHVFVMGAIDHSCKSLYAFFRGTNSDLQELGPY